MNNIALFSFYTDTDSIRLSTTYLST